MSNSFDNWLKHKKAQLESEIADDNVILNLIKNTSFDNLFISKDYIINLKIQLARLPSPYNKSPCAISLKELLFYFRKYHGLRNTLNDLAIFLPNFIKKSLARKWYAYESNVLKERLSNSVFLKN